MQKKQLLFALRRLSRHKLNTTINIVGLTLGVLACLVIYLFVSFEFSYDSFHPDRDKIFRVVRNITMPTGEEGPGSGMTAPLAADLRREATGYSIVTGINVYDSRVLVPNPNKPPTAFPAGRPGELRHMAFAEPAFLNLFPHQWLAGNPSTALQSPFSVVLTASRAQLYFGGNDPRAWLGRTLTYQDSITASVTGIVRDWTQNSDIQFTDLLSYSTIAHSPLRNYGDNGWGGWDDDAQAFVKLAPGVTAAQAEKQLPAFAARHNVLPKEIKLRLALQPLPDIHFNAAYKDSYGRRAHKPTLYALIGIAIFILLVASINFINLSTAQAVQRAREVGVRKVLGSSRLGLTSQFLTETALIVFAAMILALLLANPVISALHGFIPAGVGLNLANPVTIGFIALTVITTCLLAGWYPARVLSAIQPLLSLRGQVAQQLNSKSRLRRALIVFQFTISLVFIIGTIVVGRQIHYVLNTDLGFNKDAILAVDMPEDLPRNGREFLITQCSRLPGVQMTSLAGGSPISVFGHGNTYLANNGNLDTKIEAGCDLIDPNYILLYGLTLVAGRNMFPGDSSGAYIINETAAKALGFHHPADAIGRTFTCGFGGQPGPVVGILKDFHVGSYHEAIKPFFFLPARGRGGLLSIKLTAANRTARQAKMILDQIEKMVRSAAPQASFSARFVDEAIAQLYERERKTAQIMNLAMAIAIVISCMGLFGLAAYMANQRTKEIGIRKILGATIPDLVTMLSRDFVILVLLSTIIAAPIAGWGMHRWLQDFAYRVSIPWWIYLVAGAGAILIALLTVSFQAIRAATANPVESLRSE
jgi:putative ABC transport system permease protein